MDIKIARYESFGAIGDGKHDDLPAIVACHEYANANGLAVRADDTKTYYIGGKDITAIIKTNTNWGKARFIIDDTSLERITSDVFEVVAEGKRFVPEITSLSKNQKKIEFSHTGKVFVRVFNDNKKIYIRKGLNRDAGSAASDSFIVDGDGNILSDINWDYPTVTKAYAISVEDEPIVIEGGEFTTIANQAASFYTYHKRGISISRSNVTVRGIKHYVTGEGDHGAPYNGFICVSECYNFTFEDSLLTPHFTYWTEGADPGSKVPMGTYDFTLSGTVGVTMRSIKQTIDISDRAYWGLMGTNYSKDVLIEDCVISRYDAHCGVTNAVIRNTTLGTHALNLIGFGDFVIENSTVKAYTFINLREDYGSFFRGKVTVRNCTWDATGTANTVFNARNTGDHNFGYDCGIPKVIEIDGLTIIDNAPEVERKFYLLPNYDNNFAPGKPYAYGVPETVTLKNVKITTGRELELAMNPELYLDTQVVVI